MQLSSACQLATWTGLLLTLRGRKGTLSSPAEWGAEAGKDSALGAGFLYRKPQGKVGTHQRCGRWGREASLQGVKHLERSRVGRAPPY